MGTIIYGRVCVPLMQIGSNVYAFISGTLVSLSTNIFTTLCFEPLDLPSQWHQYVSTLFFLLSGAICMLISAKVVNFQNYISLKQIVESEAQRAIIIDATESQKTKWILYFLSFFTFFIAGFTMLGLNLILGSGAS